MALERFFRAHLLHFMQEGDTIDLGDRKLVAVEPVVRDLRTTWWGFDVDECTPRE